MTQLTERVLFHAARLVGIREASPNRGEVVDQIHLYAGRDPAQADSWCAQFVFYVFGHAAQDLRIPCPVPKTSSVNGLWERSPKSCRVTQPRSGDVFLIDHGKGKGHCGIVTSLGAGDDVLQTIEGNTSSGGSRNGDGVYARTRAVDDISLGFLRFSAPSARVA